MTTWVEATWPPSIHAVTVVPSGAGWQPPSRVTVGVGWTVAVGVGGVTAGGMAVGAGSDVGSGAARVRGVVNVAVGKGANVDNAVGAGELGVAEEAVGASTGGVASSAVRVAWIRAASVT